MGALVLSAAIAWSTNAVVFSRRAMTLEPRSATGAYSNTTGKKSAVPIDSTAAVGFVSIDRTRSRSIRARRHCAAMMSRSIRSCSAKDAAGKSRSSDSRAVWKNRTLRAVPSGERSSSSASRSTSANAAKRALFAGGAGPPSRGAALRAQATARPAAHRARTSAGCAGRRGKRHANAIEDLRTRRPILPETPLTASSRAASPDFSP